MCVTTLSGGTTPRSALTPSVYREQLILSTTSSVKSQTGREIKSRASYRGTSTCDFPLNGQTQSSYAGLVVAVSLDCLAMQD